MDDRELYDALMSTMWQDYKGFLRAEKEEDADAKYHLLTLFYLICGGLIDGIFAIVVECPPVMLAVPTIIIPIFIYNVLTKDIPRAKVGRNTYDIELTSSQYKLIRNKKKKMGLCKWDKYTSCRLLLKSKYETIVRTDDACFIIAHKKSFSKKIYYGIYNAEEKRITVPMQYDSITRPKSTADLYVAEKNGEIERFNSFGDRIIR